MVQHVNLLYVLGKKMKWLVKHGDGIYLSHITTNNFFTSGRGIGLDCIRIKRVSISLRNPHTPSSQVQRLSGTSLKI